MSWTVLDEAECAFYAGPPPSLVTEYGITVREYIVKWYAYAAVHAAFFGDPALLPD